MSFDVIRSARKGHDAPPTIRDPHNSKRQKVELTPVPLSLTPVINADDAFAQTNTVEMNPYEFSTLFKLAHFENSTIVYRAAVGSHVFKVISSGSVAPQTISVNPLQYKELCKTSSKYLGSEYVQITPFYWDYENSKHISEIEFSVSVKKTSGVSDQSVVINKYNLKNYLIELYKGQHFKNGQRFQVNLGAQAILLTVVRISLKQKVELGESQYGYFMRESRIKIHSQTDSELKLTRIIPSQRVEFLFFKVKLQNVTAASRTLGLSLRQCIIDTEFVKTRILNKIAGETVEIGTEWTIATPGNPVCCVKFKSVKMAPKAIHAYHLKNTTPVYIIDPSKMSFISTSKVILTVTQKTQTLAQKATFTVIAAALYPTCDGSKSNFVPINELKEQIQIYSITNPFVINQIMTLKLSTGEFHVQINALSSDNLTDFEKTNKLRIKWSMDPATSIYLKKKDKFDVHFVDTAIHQSLDELVISVKSVAKQPKKAVMIDEPDLYRILGDSLPPILLKENSWGSSLKDGQEVLFTVSSWSFADKTLPSPQYQYIGKITPETKITLSAEREAGIVITKPHNVLSYETAQKRIQDLKLGGMKEELEKVFRDILSSLGKFGELKSELGVSPPKGILLSGPPGTGKTTLAKNIAEILGCDKDRFVAIDGPEIWNKWVGESEQKIRDLFAPAQAAWDLYKKEKKESPLFILAIDEIDAVFPKRSSDSRRHENSVVNQFLAAMDGLKSTHNILVIGMTNHPEMLDPAFRRPGRFDIEVKFNIPDNDAKRREIIDIHMQKVIEKKMLSPDVDLDQIAKKTDGFSGADIKGVVHKAVSSTLQRLSQKDPLPNQLIVNINDLLDDPIGKVTTKDLEQAITEIKDTKAKETLPPPHMYL